MQVPTLPHVFAFQSDVSLNARIASSLTTLRRRTSSFGSCEHAAPWPCCGCFTRTRPEKNDREKIHHRNSECIRYFTNNITITVIDDCFRKSDPHYYSSVRRVYLLKLIFLFFSSFVFLISSISLIYLTIFLSLFFFFLLVPFSSTRRLLLEIEFLT